MNQEITAYGFFKKLQQLPFIDAIYLFGSRCREEQNSRADIDLAIMCPEASENQWREVLLMIDEADTLLDIDCVRFDTINNEGLRNEILNNYRVLFQRGKK